jgi:hypothetical protein
VVDANLAVIRDAYRSLIDVTAALRPSADETARSAPAAAAQPLEVTR